MGNEQSTPSTDRRTCLNTSPSPMAPVVLHKPTPESSTGWHHLNIQDDKSNQSLDSACSHNYRSTNSESTSADQHDDHIYLVERGTSYRTFARKPAQAEKLITKTFLERDNTPQREAHGRFNEIADKVTDNSFIETTMTHKTGNGKASIRDDFLNVSSNTEVETRFSCPSDTQGKTVFNLQSKVGVDLLNSSPYTDVDTDCSLPSRADSGICCDEREAGRNVSMLRTRPLYSSLMSSETDLESSLNSAPGSLLSNGSMLFTFEEFRCIDDEDRSSKTESNDENAEQNDDKHSTLHYETQDHLLLDGSTNLDTPSSPPTSDTSTDLDISSFPLTSHGCRVGLSGRAGTREPRRTYPTSGPQASGPPSCESVPDGAVGGRNAGSVCGCSDEFAAAPSSYPCKTTRDCRKHHSSANGSYGGPAEGHDGGVTSSDGQSFYGRQRTNFNNPPSPRRLYVRTYYMAYLACPADDLSTFGLTFHETIEGWGARIFISERDLPANDAKYRMMAEWLQEFCNGKVIVVVSKNFANSDECLFITYFAKTLDPDAQRSSIIPVIIDKNVEIPAILSGLTIINYNFLYKKGWLKSKLINALAA